MSDKNRTKNHESNTKITSQNVEFSCRALYREIKFLFVRDTFCSTEALTPITIAKSGIRIFPKSRMPKIALPNFVGDIFQNSKKHFRLSQSTNTKCLAIPNAPGLRNQLRLISAKNDGYGTFEDADNRQQATSPSFSASHVVILRSDSHSSRSFE